MTDPRNPRRAYHASTLARYLSDPAYAARMNAERDAGTHAFFAEHDGRQRAIQEARWAEEDIQGSLEA